MDLLSREELRLLMEERGGPCVSIYLPTHRVGAASQQDPIRFKNLIRQAEERLIAGGRRSSEAQELVRPARRLLEDDLFWQHQSGGLAVFLTRGKLSHYCLPLEFDELVVVTDRFHIKPLLRLFSGDGRFYVLALSQKHVRLLHGTRHTVSEVSVKDLPQGLADALKYDNLEKQLQLHSPGGGNRAGRPAVYHGHGDVGVDDSKDNIRRYFRQIDQGLREVLRQEPAPLVLAGVDYLLPLYRDVNSQPHVLEQGITGNPDGLSAEHLHDQAWAVVEPYFATAQEEAVAHYRQLAGTGRTSRDLRRIVPAAHEGRVNSLFVALGVQRWGTYDPDAGDVSVHDERRVGDEDLLDLAAVQTLLHAGSVYAVDPDLVPDEDTHGPVAAVFRY